MATKDEVRRLISKTASESLTWVVAGLPVVACFPVEADAESCEYLGTTTNRNDCEESLLLWIALDKDACQLLITLTIRIKATTNRKPNHRLLYLVIPADDLTLRNSAADYDSLNHLSRDLFETPHDLRSRKHKMLQLAFEPTSKASFVIMRSYPVPPKLGVQPEILLHKFKHLSEASGFSFYANHDHDTQSAIEAVCAILQSNPKPVTPQINLQGLYPGGRPGCINNWAKQGLRPNRPDTTVRNPHQAPDCIGQNPSAPPPYAKSGPVELSRPALVAASVDSPDLPQLPLNAIYEPVQEPSWLPGTDVASSSVQTPPHPLASAPASRSSRIFSSREPPTPPMPESTLSPGYTATFLSCRFYHGNAPAIQVAASPSDSSASSRVRLTTSAYTPNGIPDSARKRHSSLLSNPEYGSAKRAANRSFTPVKPSGLPSTRLPATRAAPADPSPTIFGPSLYHSTEGDRRISPAKPETSHLSSWLEKAWKICPGAHYTFIPELLRLGVATESGNAGDIASSRVDCTRALLRQGLRERLEQKFDMTHAAERDVGDDTSALVSWLYSLQPGADVDFYNSLLELALVEDQLLQSSRKAAEYDRLSAAFLHRKAELVSLACTRYGKEVLQQDQGSVVARMIRDMDRLAPNTRTLGS